MTNEQLAILLDGVYQSLSFAIDDARRSIAETRPQSTERVHTDVRCSGLFCQNNDHFSMIPVADSVDELGPLDSMLRQLEDQIGTLRRPL